MPFSTAGANRMLDAWAGAPSGNPVTHASLHNNIPSDVGSNEISGGSPAYARKAVVFAAASSGAMSKNATDPIFDIPGGVSVFFAGYWSSLVGGTFLGYGPLSGGGIDGYATMDVSGVATSYAHGLVDGAVIQVFAPIGALLPSGLDASVLYTVTSSTTDTLMLLSSGVPTLIFTNGEFYFQKVFGETYGSQGTITFDNATFTI